MKVSLSILRCSFPFPGTHYIFPPLKNTQVSGHSLSRMHKYGAFVIVFYSNTGSLEREEFDREWLCNQFSKMSSDLLYTHGKERQDGLCSENCWEKGRKQ